MLAITTKIARIEAEITLIDRQLSKLGYRFAMPFEKYREVMVLIDEKIKLVKQLRQLGHCCYRHSEDSCDHSQDR